MGILDDLYGYNSGPVQSNTLMTNPDYSAGQQGNTVGGIGNTSGMGLDLNWSTPTTQTLSVGDIFETPAGNYQAVDNGYGQIGLAPMGGAIQTGSDIQYNVAHGEHHYGVDPNTGEAWYQQIQGPSASFYSTEYDVPANTSSNTTSNTSSNTTSVSTSDVNALYNELLGRSGADQFLQNWANSGMSLDEIAAGILNSPEGQAYAAMQTETNNSGAMVPGAPDDGIDPPISTSNTASSNSNNSGALTAASLASALSMLMPQSQPTPPSVVGPSSGGSFNPAPIQTLNYSSPSLAPVSSSNNIDYVKQMRAGLFKDLV